MRGHKLDILGMHIERDHQSDDPLNRFVFQREEIPEMGLDPAHVLLSQREIPMMVKTSIKPIQTSVKDENFQITRSGGLVDLPQRFRRAE